MGLNKPLRDLAMEECLALSKDAMTIFDGIEEGAIGMETARAVVSMGERANAIALAVRTLVVTRG